MKYHDAGGSMISPILNTFTTAANTSNDNWVYIAFIIVLGILVVLLAGILIFTVKRFPSTFKWLGGIAGQMKSFFAGIYERTIKSKSFNKLISPTGFEYDPAQDIYYSKLDCWQREYGYSRLYDETAALTGMIIDCEPVYFEYDGKKWLIELWKGQYDLTTGFEIGVYNTGGPEINIPDLFNGTRYNSANHHELLYMSCTLYKNSEKLFERHERHWWLTGFRVGEFSNPSELQMAVSITLIDEEMLYQFVNALKDMKYTEPDLHIKGRTVSFLFNKPHSVQPHSRTKEIEAITQWKNKLMCDIYKDLTTNYNNTPQKIYSIRKKKPEIYQKIRDIGKSKKRYDLYKTFQEYADNRPEEQ